MDFSSLKNIDLQKLKDINIKDIDFKQLKDIDSEQLKYLAKRYLDVVVIVASVLVTIIGSIQIFSGYAKNTKTIKSDVNTQQSLLAVVEQNKIHTKTYADIRKKFGPFLAGDEIISEISNIAVNTNVQIEKLTPRKEKKNELFQVSYLDLELSSKNYDDIIAFAKSIELLENSIRIESWSASTKSFQEAVSTTVTDRGKTKKETVTVEKISLKMTLSSINIL